VKQVKVALQASDPLSGAGIAGTLRDRPDLVLLDDTDAADADVLLVSCAQVGASEMAMLRTKAAAIGSPVVLVTGDIDEHDLLAVVSLRVVVVLLRDTLTFENLVRGVVTAAMGGGAMPAHLLGGLFKQIERLQHDILTGNGPKAAGFTSREIDVLHLLADGLDTTEIAAKLNYSERSVKNVIHDLIHRHHLRNRLHAVAHAIRAGAI
jgi:DNA-binding NarL/FixJ family response regulator